MPSRPDARPTVIKLCLGLLLAAAPVLADEVKPAPPLKRTPVERMAMPRLRATHEDVQKFRKLRATVPPLAGLHDYRCILHAHAEDSDHTGGTLPEMLAEAKKAGINAILLTDHFRPPRDFIDGRWRGLKDGVLFIPGSEIRGCLLYPEASVLDKMDKPFPELSKAVTAGDGMIFLSHVEERKDHPLEGLTGLEIYNRHWDAKKDMGSLIALAMKLTDPKQLAELEDALRLYPDELFAFQCDYPQVYVDKWDAGTKTLRLTGVAANDCHHNQVMVVKMVDEETVLLGTNVDKDEGMRKITAGSRPGIKEMTKGRKPGDILARVDVDPYHRSFWNSSTHVLAPKLDEPTLRTALKAGHAFVAHDWMCEATGFRLEAIATDGKSAGIFGDELKYSEGLKLRAQFPLACQARLLRNGVLMAESSGKDRAEFPVTESGVYRLEAWLTLDGESRPWIFANPIYVR
ncbi:MAG: histidinol phosphatase [Pedosphaera sp.]|nr:histidinol phosphatase [Pedosphaera sp.]